MDGSPNNDDAGEVVTPELVDAFEADPLALFANVMGAIGDVAGDGDPLFSSVMSAVTQMVGIAANDADAAAARTEHDRQVLLTMAADVAWIRALIEKALAGTSNPVVRKLIGL